MMGRLVRGAEVAAHWLALAVIALAPVPFGSPSRAWVALWCAMLGVSLLPVLFRRTSLPHPRSILVAASLLLAWIAVALLQQASPSWTGIVDPVWHEAAVQNAGAASARAAATATSPWLFLGMPLLAALVFMRTLISAGNADGCAGMFQILRWSILAGGVLSFVAYRVAPGSLLGEPKVFYLGAFTGTFVNANVAASYYGMGAVLWTVRVAGFATGKRIRLSRSWEGMFVQVTNRVTPERLLACFAWLACLGFVAMTGSRAGLLLSVLSCCLVALIILRRRLHRRSLYLLPVLGLAAIVGAQVLVLGGGVGARMGRDGLFDPFRAEVYRLCIELLAERPWLGIGAGAFPAVFPSIRSAKLGMFGVWDRAHSTPLELAVEMGLPYAGAVLLAWSLIFILLVKASLSGSSQRSQLAAGGVGCMALVGLHSLVDFPLQTAGLLVPFVAIVAAGVACSGASVPHIAVNRQTNNVNTIESV